MPRCLCAGSSPRFLGRGSFLSPGRDYILGLPRMFCPRHPHSTLFNIMFVVSLSLLDFCIARLRRRSSFSHGRPSGNVRGSNASCLPQRVRVRTRFVPTRARTRETPLNSQPIFYNTNQVVFIVINTMARKNNNFATLILDQLKNNPISF